MRIASGIQATPGMGRRSSRGGSTMSSQSFERPTSRGPGRTPVTPASAKPAAKTPEQRLFPMRDGGPSGTAKAPHAASSASPRRGDVAQVDEAEIDVVGSGDLPEEKAGRRGAYAQKACDVIGRSIDRTLSPPPCSQGAFGCAERAGRRTDHGGPAEVPLRPDPWDSGLPRPARSCACFRHVEGDHGPTVLLRPGLGVILDEKRRELPFVGHVPGFGGEELEPARAVVDENDARPLASFLLRRERREGRLGTGVGAYLGLAFDPDLGGELGLVNGLAGSRIGTD